MSDDISRYLQRGATVPVDHETTQALLTALQFSREDAERLASCLRKLSFMAQTTGGVAGPDAELMSAINTAEKVLIQHDNRNA
jgi:hypothetical protein